MKKSICLTMIVKNEEHVIRRSLDSVRPLIDSWSIVDTGSADGTVDVIEKTMRGVPGEVHHRRWRNFGENRTEAIQLAGDRADYLFFLDADDIVQIPPDFRLPDLTADAYQLEMIHGDTRYWRTYFASTRLPWRYEGVLHEYLTTDGPHSIELLKGPTVTFGGDGGRTSGIDLATKYERDAAILEEGLRKEPENSRYIFYLGQSYRDCGRFRDALRAYEQRAGMGGWDEEVWYSLFQLGVLSERLKLGANAISARYLAAYQFRPTRAEPLVELARIHREREEYALAHLYAERAMQIERPADRLFLDHAAYAWRARDEYSVACYWMGRYEETMRVCSELLASPELPAEHRTRVGENLNWAVSKISG